MTSLDVSAIVLAGGLASRFGGPKLATPIEGVPLLHRAIRAAATVAAEVVVVAAPGDAPELAPAPVPLRVAHDPVADGGPLVGLAAGLRTAAGTSALVVGGDMPRLSPAVLALMLERLAAGDADAVILASPASPDDPVGRTGQPRQALPMAVRTGPALLAADAVLARGRHSLQALLDALAVVELPAESWLRLDPAGGTLDDVDEPADVDRLDRAPITPSDT